MGKITDNYPGHKIVRLGIGEGGVYEKPTVITTVLGSCVSVTFFSREKRIGAIFHALLPTRKEKEKNMLMKNCYKYVDTAIQHILHSLYRRGIKKNQIETKVFGGAQSANCTVLKPGESNIMTAYEVLAEHNIKIAASDVGGERGRNLVFVTNTGEVYIKNLREDMLGAARNSFVKA